MSGCSLFQKSPIECGVSECNREASIMRRPWPKRGCRDMERKRGTSYRQIHKEMVRMWKEHVVACF